MLGLLLFVAQVVTAPERPKEVLALVDRARALPPEFSADVMLRLAASRLVPDPAWRHELIEEAFASGAHAQMPYARQAYGMSADSRPNLKYPSSHLEALTLQARAVNAMLAIDPPRALALFRDIVPPDLPPLTCQDAATPDLSAYYQAAERLFESAFTPKQRAAEEDVQLLARIIGSIQSSSQVVPALKMMPDAGARMTPAQRQQLAGALAGVLDRLAGGDREYSASEKVLVTSALPEMHDSQMFVPALRSYIVRHLSGARCSDSMPAAGLPESAQQFNALIARLLQTTAQLRPITAEEAKPSKDEGTFEKHLMWQSAKARQVLIATTRLNEVERLSPEWNARYLEAAKLVEGWQESEEESPDDYAFMAALAHETLAKSAPAGKPANSWLSFLEQRYTQMQNRNFWFALVERMLQAGQIDASRSSNPIIALYAEVAARIGRP